MSNRKIIFSILFCFALGISILSGQSKLLTTAESSNYQKTSTYSDVMEFIHALQKEHKNIRVESLCKSIENRDIPLVIIGDPLPASYMDLKYDSRMVVYIQANIHAGEVEGKEASLMLIRDMLKGYKKEWLDNLVILITPIFNPDGNEKFSEKNRTTQNGPEKVGVRYNGQFLDLNRDGIKLESPEVKSMVKKILNTWDPALLIDCHTTNGSYHEEPVTFVWGNNPNGDNDLIEYMRTRFRPFIIKNMKKEYNVLAVEYGHFMDYKNLEKGWGSVGPEARYIVNYMGLRNRLALLNENYTYADFQTRVEGCYALLSSSLTFCNENKEEILKMFKIADQNTIKRGLNPTEIDSFIVDYELIAEEGKITLLGYEMNIKMRENGWPKLEKLNKKRKYKMPYFCQNISKHSVKFPYGYIIEFYNDEIINNLLNHGITVEKIVESVTLEVETFNLKEVTATKQPYQGHYMNTVKGDNEIIKRTFNKDCLFVSTGQRLGGLVAYLLEPECEDGLLTWNFFDRYIVRQWRGLGFYPVYKIYSPVNLVKVVMTTS